MRYWFSEEIGTGWVVRVRVDAGAGEEKL